MTNLRASCTVLSEFQARLDESPEATAIHYFGNSISRRELNRLSDNFASWLRSERIEVGDRVAVSLQNTPMFAVALLAAWKVGAVFVPVSPLLRMGELSALLADSRSRVLLAHPDMVDVVTGAAAQLQHPPALLWSHPSDLAGDQHGPWDGSPVDIPRQGLPVLPILETREAEALAGEHVTVSPDSLAVLAYTSGTTGPSKGAMLTHANIGYQAEVSPDWLGLKEGDSVLTIAPFFHITGLGLHLALGLGRGLPLVMTYRFEPSLALQLIERYQPTFTVGTITAFIALADTADSSARSRTVLSRLTSAVSGGAAVPAAVVERYERDFGVYIRNGYGLTESASACVVVPAGVRAPIDPDTGALSIGQPMPGVSITAVAENGSPVPAGETGELVIRGSQVGIGYWERPEESTLTFREDGLHTGDVGRVDEQGWVYLVDRIKDLIVVSGYKVWPRDVEDVLYRHPAVAEAAVVGVPDDYRGESVAAYVVAKPGMTVTADALNTHCREYLSAYKCPRRYDIVDVLPKSASGKILRRLLRESESTELAG